MIKFIVNEQPSEKGIHHIHNASLGCADLPSSEDQILIGYFANYELAYKRARMNWPREKSKVVTSVVSNNQKQKSSAIYAELFIVGYGCSIF